MRQRIIALLAVFACCTASLAATEVSGTWELLPLSIVVESKFLDTSRMSSDEAEKVHIGEALALVEPESAQSWSISVDRRNHELAFNGDTAEYSRTGDVLTVQEPDSKFTARFAEMGEGMLCLLQFNSTDQASYVVLAEAHPREDAAVGPFPGSGSPSESTGTAKAPPGMKLAGSRFVHDSGDVVLRFRSARVKVSVMGYTSGNFAYEQQDDYVYVHDPGAGTVEYEIIDSDTLYTDQFGMEGYYRRE